MNKKIGDLVRALYLVALLILCSKNSWAQQHTQHIKGLRVDPSYFYEIYPNQSAAEIANNVVKNALRAHVNTLFIYAHNPTSGAFYKTDYPMIEIEPVMGESQIFSVIYNQARAAGLLVVAVIPILDFERVWQTHPEWRSKTLDGNDYQPFSNVFHLSAWHPGYRKWLRGYFADLLHRFSGLYAIEAVEPTIDCFWKIEADFNPVANQQFQQFYPQGTLGDSNWRKFRAQGVTDLLAIMSEEAHAQNIKSGVVQTWPAHANGELFKMEQVRDEVGFDFDGIMNLQGAQKVDLVTGEILWQQWAGEFGDTVFNPEWTRQAAFDFLSHVNGRAYPILHVEISTWEGQNSTVTPTVDEFMESLLVIKDISAGIDVYDYSQMVKSQAWSALSNWK